MKRILLVIMCLFLLVGCGKKEESGWKGTITLDINPSLQINMERGIVKEVKALNEDAEEYITPDMKNNVLPDVYDAIISHAKEKGLVENGELYIILGLEEENKEAEQWLKESCEKNDIRPNIIVPEITEDARREADGYGVTPAKAAVILEAMKGNEDIHFDDLKDKSAKELSETKETGMYCNRDYTLRNGKCERVIREEKPQEGKTCPEGYEEIKNKCYKISDVTTHEPYCKDGMELKDNKCVGTEKVDATAKCSTGTYNSKTKKCEVSELVGEGTKKCRESEDLLLDNGKCASHHMGAHFDDPGATIDPATECCCGDTYKNGWCYSLPNGNYDATVTCPSGQTAKDGKCYKVTSSDPTYTCSKGTLDGTKCVIETTKDPSLKVACGKGLTSYQDRACIDYKDTAEYVTGLTCSKDARLEDERCVYYEVADPIGK